MLSRHLLICLALSLTCLVAPAYAAPATHDGFFLRFTPGIGYVSTSESVSDLSIGISGVGVLGGFSLGWAVVDNLILHLDFASAQLVNPSVSLTRGGTTISKDATASETLSSFGAGASYYIMPANIYIGGAIHAATLSLDTNTSHVDSGLGWGLALNAGKEWWVSDNWGLGLAAQVRFSSVPDTGPNAQRLNSPVTGLTFSATYN